MNFHDNVHILVKSLKETSEFKEYIKVKSEILKDEELSKLVKEFKDKQREQHIKHINGGKIEEKDTIELQDLYTKLIQNENTKKLFELEIRLDVLLADMQKIIAEGIKEILEF